MSSNNKIHNSAQKQRYYKHAEELHNNEKSLDIDAHIRPKETVTISKDLWTQVQQCLCLMTSVFSHLNSECNEEKDLAKHCNERPYQREPTLTRASVKQQLFDDSTTQASIPKGKVVEKIFIRQKGLSRSSIELASRETFLHDKTNKISEIDALDSGYCNQNSCDIDTSSQDYSSSSSSRPMVDGLTSKKLIVSETSERDCSESCNPKSSMENSCAKFSAGSKKLSSQVSCVTDKCYNHTSPYHQPFLELLPSKIFGECDKSTKKKRRPRYRLVRRRSSSSKSQGRSREDTTSEHESDSGKTWNFEKNEFNRCLSTGTSAQVSDTSGKRHAARNKHSFDQCLSDNDDFHIPEKASKKTAVEDNEPTESYSSPEIDDLILVEAPPAPLVNNKPERRQALRSGRNPVKYSSLPRSSNSSIYPSAIDRNKRPLMNGSSDGHCHSSTPRKHGGVKNIAPSANPANRNGSLEIMPSPIKSTLNTNATETLANSTLTSNESHFDVASPNCQKYNSLLSSPIARKSQSECSILQPEISVSFLAKKDIFERSSSDNDKRSNIRSDENNHAYSKRLFPGLPQERFPASFSPSDDHLTNKDRSKKNQRENVMPKSGRSSRSTLNKSPEVVSRAKPVFEADHDRSKSRSELCATDRELVTSNNSSMFEYPHHKKESKIMSSWKLNRSKHSPENFTRPSNEHQQSKITPRRAKHHPYATSNKFPRIPASHSPFQSSGVRTPSLISPFQDLRIKSPSSPRHKWTTLDRSPMAMCFKQARQISDPVVASRTILQFGSDNSRSENEKKYREETKSSNKMKNRTTSKKSTTQASNTTDHHFVDDLRSNCSNGKCLKAFCFNCSMELS